MVHVLLDINGYIGMSLNNRLVHDLYLKSMEVHLSMIDSEKLSCKSICLIFLFFIIKFLQVTMLVGAMDVSS